MEIFKKVGEYSQTKLRIVVGLRIKRRKTKPMTTIRMNANANKFMDNTDWASYVGPENMNSLAGPLVMEHKSTKI